MRANTGNYFDKPGFFVFVFVLKQITLKGKEKPFTISYRETVQEYFVNLEAIFRVLHAFGSLQVPIKTGIPFNLFNFRASLPILFQEKQI